MSPFFGAAAVAAALSLSLAPGAAPALASERPPEARPHVQVHARITTAYELPGDRVYPEGVAADARTGVLYAGSYADGTIYRATPGRKAAEVFLPAGADGRDTANGLKVDRAGRLWVTDSTTGVAVYDTRTRRLLASFTVPGEGARFVNDLAIAPDGGAYVTDSVRAVVYRATPRQLAQGGGTLVPRFDLSGVLEPHAPDAFTLNGIVAAGRHLLAVDMTGGDLYRLDPATGGIRKVALRGGDLLHADGLEFQHGRLWAVQNTTNTVTRWRVSRDGSAVSLERRLTDTSLRVPTTLARHGGTLYVVRSQFDRGGPMGPGVPETPFTIAAVRGL
ncbi:SMP-30/gluconolactonase/LRE family protein [Actinomadura rugatobispora]|uniref:SMP-30/gluconolactonase/LRE family protein n=1 Tax=Actinomadura rugatobispora TaxID=1994 RepID=A0ABW1AE67_9ACTN|nr:hypothetical protein GCM10010200_068520 [Actinomadura rugatobispora]